MKTREGFVGAVACRLCELGFSEECAAAIASYTNTKYTSKRMMSYLKNAAPASLEEVVDELLIILEERDRLTRKYRHSVRLF